MKKTFNKTTCFLLLLLLFAGAALFHPFSARAAESTKYSILYSSSAPEVSLAGQTRDYTFSTKSSGTLYINLYLKQPTTFTYLLTAASGEMISEGEIQEDDTDWYKAQGYDLYANGCVYSNPTVGNFTFSVTTPSDCEYIIIVSQDAPKASISNTSITITNGFTHKLSVSNVTGKINWKSTKPEIATVNSKGVVSAKKKGNCTITASTEDGQTVKCKVKVAENVYKEEKVTNSDISNGSVTAYVYHAALDADGNLKCKIRIVNNSSRTVIRIANTDIAVKNAQGKVIYSYPIKSKTITVPAYSYKDFSSTIPKSKVKKCDLVKGNIRMNGTYYYR